MRADKDVLRAHVDIWAAENRVSPGPLAGMLSEIAADLVKVDESKRARPAPTTGFVCDAQWWQGNTMEWRVLRLDDGYEVMREREPKGSINVAHWLAITEALKWVDENALSDKIYSPSFVALRWIRNRQFNCGEELPLWVSQFVPQFYSTRWAIDQLDWWDEGQWGKTPANFGGLDHRQQWDVR